MKVLILSASYMPVLGGLQTATHSLARNLVQCGHSVWVVTDRYPRTLPAREITDGVQVSRVPFITSEMKYLLDGRPDLFFASFYYYPAACNSLNGIMDAYQPDIVNLHFPDRLIPFVLKIRKKFSFRLVVSLHGDDILRWFDEEGTKIVKSRNKYAHYARLQSILEQAEVVTACSHALLNKAAQISPKIASKGQVLQNGVDFHRFTDRSVYAHPRPYVFAFGRLVYRKGFDLLLDAFARFSLDHPQIDLIVAGEGEKNLELKAYCAENGIYERVLFFGRATQQDVVQLLNGCLFAIIPSRQEPFGITALEALAAGRPVLATRVGGMAELLAQYPDYSRLVEPNVGALADGLEEMLKVLPSLANLPPLSLDQYSWENLAKKYEKILCA